MMLLLLSMSMSSGDLVWRVGYALCACAAIIFWAWSGFRRRPQARRVDIVPVGFGVIMACLCVLALVWWS